MKAIIAIAVAAAFALPACAQQENSASGSTLPDAKERAENREAVSSTASNATLTTKVKTALAADVGLSTVTSINVDSDSGVVTLKGAVDSADKKAKAEEIAKGVEGVKSVKNELKVEASKDKSS
jgi:hyperosmotically inducible protein